MKYIVYLPIVHFVHRTETGHIGPTATPRNGDAVFHSVYQAWFTGQTRPIVGESLPIFTAENQLFPWMEMAVEHITHLPAINPNKPTKARRNLRNLVVVLEPKYLGVPYPMEDESPISQPAGYRAVSKDAVTAALFRTLERAGFTLGQLIQNSPHQWNCPLPIPPTTK